MIQEYYQPDQLNKALQIRRDCGESSLLAGGTDLVVAMHKEEGPEGNLIDLSKILELKGVSMDDGSIRIGAMTTFTGIADSELLRNNAEVLCKAAEAVGSPQIRNRATIGGNICNASAAADSLASLLCLDAKIELQSMTADGAVHVRNLPLEDFVIDSKKTALKGSEIMTAILFKPSMKDVLSAFQKIGRRNSLAIARLNGCCIIRRKAGKAESVHLALGAATSKPERIRNVELLLAGRELNEETLNAAGKQAAEYVLGKTGLRDSSVYKLPVIEKFTVALIQDALGKEE